MATGFDPSKLAPTLAAVAGAYAAPGNPSLGAQLGAGLGSALFPTQEDKQIQELRGLQIEGAKQNLEQGKLAMLAGKQAMDLNQSQEQRAKARETRELEEFGVKLPGMKATTEAQQLALGQAKGEIAYNFLKSGADGGGKVALEGLSQVVSQATGRPATADDLAKWQTHPAAMGLVRVQRFIGAVQSMDEANPDQQAAISRFAAEAGLNAKFVDGKLTIVDPFGQSDLNKDGTINAEDISMLKQTLTQTVAKEAAYQEMVTGMKNNPVSALAGVEAGRMVDAYQRNTDDPNPTERAATETDAIATRYGKGHLAAASMIGWFTNNPNDPSLIGYQEAFNNAHKSDGMSIVLDEMGGGNHFVQISKGNPWVNKHILLMKAIGQTGAISEDDYNVRIPVQQYRDYVEKSFRSEIDAALPKADPFAKAFNEMSYDGTPIFVDAVDDKGKPKKEEIPLGVWAQQKWIDGARAIIAGTNGDQAKISGKEFDQFRKTDEGRFLMIKIMREANSMLPKENTTRTANSPALSKGEETRQMATKGDPASLASVAAVQGVQRKAAGGEPSVAMKRALSEVQKDFERKKEIVPYGPTEVVPYSPFTTLGP